VIEAKTGAPALFTVILQQFPSGDFIITPELIVLIRISPVWTVTFPLSEILIRSVLVAPGVAVVPKIKYVPRLFPVYISIAAPVE
jgi:hypothetical protein